MTIKNRLIGSFSLMIAIVGIMAIILFVQGKAQRYYLRQSVQNYSFSAGIREIQYYLEKSASAYDFYLVLSDISEKNRFLEYSKLLTEKTNNYINELKNFKVSKTEYNSFLEIAENSELLTTKWKNSFAIYESGSRGKTKVLSAVDENILPHFNKLKTELACIYQTKLKAFKSAETKSLVIAKINFLISAGFSVLAVVLAAILSVILFRSISHPLTKLKEGAARIGAGNFNSEIQLSGGKNNELTLLADAFNKMAQNLKVKETQIIQMDRMASLGQLAGGIAHELNNPLTGVLGQSQIILEKLPQADPLRDTLEKITRAAERCRKITKGLLDFARQKDYYFEPTDISKVVDSSLEICSSDIAASNIHIIRNYRTNIPKLKVSIPHIQQVFLNIITNAIHSMPAGGTLTITTEARSKSQEARNQKLESDILPLTSCILVSFKDTGIGIPKANIDKIFTPFFTTKEPGKGTGLGLAISYGIVQRHNGTVMVSSEGEKKGATFTVKLPI
ncbi:MAG: HAMP domain-containing sensor histidine kinase [Elusimicrobiota bacterium]